jgi:hypothetical protein
MKRHPLTELVSKAVQRRHREFTKWFKVFTSIDVFKEADKHSAWYGWNAAHEHMAKKKRRNPCR